jgi:hypothetical protein
MAKGVVSLNPILRAGAITCTVVAFGIPPTGVVITTVIGSVTIPAYRIALSPGSAYTFQYNLNGDAVTVLLNASATGEITWQAAATPAGGETVSMSGSV